jgi:hypothetical protein
MMAVPDAPDGEAGQRTVVHSDALMPRRPSPNLADLRVGVLTEMDTWSASTRARAEQHLPRLRARFHQVDWLPARDVLTRDPGRVGQVRFFATHAGRYAARVAEIRRAVSRYDALFIQRGLYVMGPGTIVRPVERYGGRVVLDLDDDLIGPRDGLGRAARWLYGPQQTVRLLERADAVLVSTAAVAEALPPGAPAPVILPTVPDPARYPLRHHLPGLPTRVVWAGTSGSLHYLGPLGSVFERLQREGTAELTVLSSAPPPILATFRAWRPEQATTCFAAFDIGIMPLPDTPFARAKAGFKLLEYMAAGLPVVASPIGVNPELVRRSGAGMLAATAAEWEEALRELSASVELRRELGTRGRRFVEAYADLDHQADVLAEAIRG